MGKCVEAGMLMELDPVTKSDRTAFAGEVAIEETGTAEEAGLGEGGAAVPAEE